MSAESLRVALVTPFAWPEPSAVNQHVADLARELVARGHRPVVLCSSDDVGELQRMRRLCRHADGRAPALLAAWTAAAPPHDELLPPEGSGPLSRGEGIPVVPLGRSFSTWANGSVASIGLPLDVTSRLERLLVGGGFDLVHVHEPIAPSLSFTAIREARSPVVATFHSTPVGLLGYELGHRLLGRFYERLDGRVVTSTQAAQVLRDFFGGRYRVVPPGTRLAASPIVPAAPDWGPGPGDGGAPDRRPAPGSAAPPRGLYIYRGDDRRGLRAFLRALTTAFPEELTQIVVALHRASADRWPPRPAPRALRSRVTWVDFADTLELQLLYDQAGLVFLPYLGGEWLLPAISEAVVCGRPVVAPDLPVVRDVLAHVPGARFFDPARDQSLATCLRADRGCVWPGDIQAREAGTEPVGTAPAGGSGRDSGRVTPHTMPAVADAVLELYREVMSTTVGPSGMTMAGAPGGHRSSARRGVAGAPGRFASVADDRDWIHADLHVHTIYSKDCTVPVEAVLATAREVGLGAIAIADHNTIIGALEAAKSADEALCVIVAEEVMTQSGEVIGLFIEEAIPKGVTFEEALSLIKEQGGLVYIPHPFDRLRVTPSYRMMVDNLHHIDAIETYNARNYLASFNLNAERFAAKYGLAAGAGSDSHVLPGLGTAMLRMPRFRGPEEFMAALHEADIVTRRRSLLYLQSLKLLQSTLDRVMPVR